MTIPTPKLRRMRRAVDGKPEEVVYLPGVWLTVDGLFTVMRRDLTDPRSAWKLSGLGASGEQLDRHGLNGDQVRFRTRSDALQALALMLHQEARRPAAF